MKPSTPHLALVGETTERPAAKAQRLMLEARQASDDHTEAFLSDLASVIAQAREIEHGGDAYKAGVRQECRAIADDMSNRLQSIEAIHRRLSIVAAKAVR
jgi:two-component sensor histidine kinase